MTYNNFDEWYADTEIKSDKLDPSFVVMMKEFMRQAWDAALLSFYGAKEIVKLNILRKQASICVKINELLTTINDAELIDCTCDQKQIKQGYRCACGRGQATMHAGIELGKYLRKLREGLK